MKDLILAWILTNIDDELILISLQTFHCINNDNISAFQITQITVVYNVYFIICLIIFYFIISLYIW